MTDRDVTTGPEAPAESVTPKRGYNLWYVAGVAFVASAGGFLFGYDLVIIAGALPFLTREFALSPALSGWATSSAILGAILGPLAGLWFADAIGRRRTMMLSAATFLASTIGCATAGTIGQFVIYRLIGGMGVGLAMISCPIYIAELSPAKLRGVLVNVNQLVGVIGINLAVLVSYWIAEYDGGWRLMFGSHSVLSALPIYAVIFIATLVSFPLIHRYSRRGILIASTLGMAGSHLLMSALLASHAPAVSVVLPMMLGAGSFTFGLAPLSWIIVSEIFPNRVRGAALAIVCVFLFGSSFLTAQVFPMAMDWLRQKTGTPAAMYVVFALICASCALFVWRMLPETKGLTLDEMGSFWRREVAARGGRR